MGAKVKVVFIVVFAAVMLYGFAGILGLSPSAQKGILIWAVGGVVLHDLLFAPLLFGTGHLVSKLPTALRKGTQTFGLLVGGVLLATFPTWFGRPYVTPEPGLLPNNYFHSVVVVVSVCAGIAVLVTLYTYFNDKRRTHAR